MPNLLLKSIICINPDEIDKDEIFIKVNNKKVWPIKGNYKQTDTGEKTQLDVTIPVEEGQVEVELWDYDYLSLNDHLGTFRLTIDDERDRSNSASMIPASEKSTASYLLDWSIKS